MNFAKKLAIFIFLGLFSSAVFADNSGDTNNSSSTNNSTSTATKQQKEEAAHHHKAKERRRTAVGVDKYKSNNPSSNSSN